MPDVASLGSPAKRAPTVPSRTFRYIIESDSGLAPNPEAGMCTLACCKPKIRKGANVGDWILGFGSAKTKRNGLLIYAMRVGVKHTLAEYYERHCGRRDAIYRRSASGDLEWVKNSHNDHAEERHFRRDIDGRFVLEAEPGNWWYFGQNAPDLLALLAHVPEVAYRLLPRGRGHRLNGSTPDDMIILVDALRRFEVNGGLLGESFD